MEVGGGGHGRGYAVEKWCAGVAALNVWCVSMRGGTRRPAACETGPGGRPPWQPPLLPKALRTSLAKTVRVQIDKVDDKVSDKDRKEALRRRHEAFGVRQSSAAL